MSPSGLESRGRPWKTSWVVAGGALSCALLIAAGIRWPQLLTIPGVAQYFNPPDPMSDNPAHYPFLELVKLVTAALLGLILTAVHRHTRHEKPLTSSLEHAQILLCVSGAIIMIIIGNSLARAFGIAGGAAIVRFRTPVDDPKDAMVLFLLLSIGMACGLAAFGVAVLGTIFLSILLLVLDRMEEHRPLEMTIELVSDGPEFPSGHVRQVFDRYAVQYEQREVNLGDNAVIRYLVRLNPGVSFEMLNAQLMDTNPPELRAVSWVKPKKKNA